VISSVCNACTLAASWVAPCVLDIQLALFYCTSRGYFLLEADIFILKQVMHRIHAICGMQCVHCPPQALNALRCCSNFNKA